MECLKINSLTIRSLRMKLKEPFITSFGTELDKEFLLLTVLDQDGIAGWGECVAMEQPIYNEETNVTAKHLLRDFLFPLLRGKTIRHPDELAQIFAPIRRNQMAKAALECAVWDLYARKNNLPLYQALGGSRKKIDVGISIGMQAEPKLLVRQVEKYVHAGYKRIKIKIMPGKDLHYIDAVRQAFPAVPLMADANSAYSLDDIELLKAMDGYYLMMIEQPLAHDDIIDHALLQSKINTPICLDESIHSYEDARRALSIDACRIINIKLGRVGGLTESRKIEQLCRERNIPVWCGGMLEAGVGRAFNVALTTLSGFTLPGDTAASSRYWERDIISSAVMVSNGEITVPQAAGFGYELDFEAINSFTETTAEII
ncbi:MAG: o-succinylbenzoate synthase [Bacillota bacterium]